MQQEVRWIAHNGPHDIRSIDRFLGYESNAWCDLETFIPSHHRDSRNQAEGGVGHGLKELAVALVDPHADKWEKALKEAFKEILIEIPGEVYKSGPRKGTQKYRKAKLSEGWGLIDPTDSRYVAYAAADPILAFRVWRHFRPQVRDQVGLYKFDQRVAAACDTLTRRGMPLDIDYTEKLSAAYLRRAQKLQARAAEYGCRNIHSGPQLAETLIQLGAQPTARTKTGQYVTDSNVLRGLLGSSTQVDDFIRCVLGAKQLLKRRESYTEQMLLEVDVDGRVHPSINILGARTGRMSVSAPPFQQLPTKDREEDL
jgi:DNA polymerase-1